MQMSGERPGCEEGLVNLDATTDDGSAVGMEATYYSGAGGEFVTKELQAYIDQRVQQKLDDIFHADPVKFAVDRGLALHVRGLGDTAETREWYQGRKTENIGSFVVSVVDKMGRPVTDHFTTNWKVSFALVGGNGQYLDPTDLIGLSETPLYDGRAEVDMSNMVFNKVTSKCGDSCQVVALLVSPSLLVNSVQQWRSHGMKVHSGRCKNSDKREWNDLDPDCEIHQVKGLGDVFAKRFKAASYRTVRELSEIDLGTNDRHPPQDLLKAIQGNNSNSPFTASKFIDLVLKARGVVRAFRTTSSSPSSTTILESSSSPQPTCSRAHELTQPSHSLTDSACAVQEDYPESILGKRTCWEPQPISDSDPYGFSDSDDVCRMFLKLSDDGSADLN